MGLITKNIPQMYTIFDGISALDPVFWQKFDEMHYIVIKNLTQEFQNLFPKHKKIMKSHEISTFMLIKLAGLL